MRKIILWRESKKDKEHYEILHQIPVLLDMGRYSQIGIITKDTIAGMELVRSIILQIALCNLLYGSKDRMYL